MDNSMAFTYDSSICPPLWPTHGTHLPPQKAPSCISSQYHHPHPSGHHCSDSVPTYCFNCGSNSYSGIDTACTLGSCTLSFLVFEFHSCCYMHQQFLFHDWVLFLCAKSYFMWNSTGKWSSSTWSISEFIILFVLCWPTSSFGFFRKIELFDQPNIILHIYITQPKHIRNIIFFIIYNCSHLALSFLLSLMAEEKHTYDNEK